MKLAMTPDDMARYRQSTAEHKPINPQKYCAPCKRKRSLRQFSEGSNVCLICAKRGYK